MPAAVLSRACRKTLPSQAQRPATARSRRTLQSTNSSSNVCPTTPVNWQPLDEPLLWQGTAEETLASGSPLLSAPPPWKMMIMSDGSVTRHLQLITQKPVVVECLEMRDIGSSNEGLPAGTALIQGNLVQRQVLLRAGPGGPALVYAASWWCADTVDSYLKDRSQPIWVSLSQGQVELHRDIQTVFAGGSSELQQHLGPGGLFWGRQYLFWHNGRPLTLIHEVFSRRLDTYLGPLT